LGFGIIFLISDNESLGNGVGEKSSFFFYGNCIGDDNCFGVNIGQIG